MLHLFFLTLLLFSTGFAMDKEEIRKNPKKIIEEKAITPEDYCRKAIAYVYDQEVDRAFVAFLKALDLTKETAKISFESGEKELFDKAISIYLVEGASDPFNAAQSLLEEFEGVVKVHPEYANLHFLISTAYGNLGMYDQFFESFFKHYSSFKNTYLAYKIQGILFLRLSQHAKSEDEKRQLCLSAKEVIEKALEKSAEDMSLYKVLVYLAKERENSQQIKDILKQMIATEGTIPRCDLMAHIKEACALKEYDMAQQIIDKARKDYQYSRTLIAAEEYLKQAKG